MPIQLKQEHRVNAVLAEEIKDASKLLPNDEESQPSKRESPVYDFRSNLNDEEKKELLSKFDLIKTRKITYDKPILIIYNPRSGRQNNLVPIIEAKLKIEKIPFEFMRTEKARDTYFFAK